MMWSGLGWVAQRLCHHLVLVSSIVCCMTGAAHAQTAEFAALVKKLDADSYSEKAAAVEALAASGDARAADVIEALSAGTLYQRQDGIIVITKSQGATGEILDAATGASLGPAVSADLKLININNRVRSVITTALGSMSSISKNPVERKKSADSIFKSRDASKLPLIEKAITAETDPVVRLAFTQARAAIILGSDANTSEKLSAVRVLQARGDLEAAGMLRSAASGAQVVSGDEVAQAAATAAASIEQQLALWGGLQNIVYGLSLGSVLLLAAIGLAITFGVMGVINMAHGEMVMIGAYVTFVVQEIIRTKAPWLFGASLFIALPLAFLIAGGIGVAIERGMIRFLYGRPLETLLATFGLSLMLQQAVRSLFGPTNREVGTPQWMSGSVDLGGLTLTLNRLYIILFALAVFAALQFLLKNSAFGLRMRAVTQNREMAQSMGIRSGTVDALTFGLGSGIAGIAGVALSQIDNVSPNLGQGYIIDSFMVVVFGGVGNLWGTLVGAMTLGIVNKFLEPYAGAVLGKILVLVLLILFIQKRPRGLFALKGRSVEA